MQAIFDIVYFIVFLSYLILTLFIVFHIAKFSINKRVAAFALIFFLAGTILLLFSNAILFFSIPFDSLKLPTFSHSPSSPF